MNKSQLVDALAERFEGNRKQAAQALDAVLDTITREVARGEKVAISGFGSFERRIRGARTVRNPRTGEQMTSQEKAVPRFKPGADLRDVVAGVKKLPELTIAAATAPARAAVKVARSATGGDDGSTASRSSADKAPAKKAPAKKAAATSSSATGTAATKSATTKSATTKSAATRSSATTSTASTSTTAKKSTAAKKSATAKKSAAAKKTTAAKKSTAKKTTAKKSSASKKTAAKKSPSDNAPAKKATPPSDA